MGEDPVTQFPDGLGDGRPRSGVAYQHVTETLAAEFLAGCRACFDDTVGKEEDRVARLQDYVGATRSVRRPCRWEDRW